MLTLSKTTIWVLSLLLLGLSSCCIFAQLPVLPWNNVIVVGQSDTNSRVSGVSATRLNQPSSLFIFGNKLLVSDYENARLVTYNLPNIPTFNASIESVLNSTDFNTKGTTKINAVEGYIQDSTLYIWAGILPDIVSRYTFPFASTPTSPDPISISSNPKFNFPQTVKVDVANQLLYVVDTNNNRVLQYSSSNLTVPLRIYGQVSATGVRPNQGGRASVTSLFNPVKVVLGCNNDLYIVDARNNRVLKYNNNNTVAIAVIGQNTFTASGASSAAQGFNLPYSATITSDCSFMWVADAGNNRVVKVNIQNLNGLEAAPSTRAVGAIGNVTSSGPARDRFKPFDIHVDKSTGRLWLADAGNNRVIGAVSCDTEDEYTVNSECFDVCGDAELTFCGICDANR